MPMAATAGDFNFSELKKNQTTSPAGGERTNTENWARRGIAEVYTAVAFLVTYSRPAKF